jgi:hypothetical protein
LIGFDYCAFAAQHRVLQHNLPGADMQRFCNVATWLGKPSTRPSEFQWLML